MKVTNSTTFPSHPTDLTLAMNARQHRRVATAIGNTVGVILSRVNYKDGWEFVIGSDNYLVYMQPRFWRRDVVNDRMDWGYGGKGYVSETATTSQIVQMAFGLIKGAEEHEAREHFTYEDVRIFGPHIDVLALTAAAQQTDREWVNT